MNAIVKLVSIAASVLVVICVAVLAMAQAINIVGLNNLTVACVAANPAAAITTAPYTGSLACWNMSNTPVYLGGANVTTTNGLPVCKDGTVCPISFWPPDAETGVVYYDCAVNVTFYCMGAAISGGQ